MTTKLLKFAKFASNNSEISIILSGKKKSKPFCVKVQDGKESDADEHNCLYLPKPETVTKACNQHCRLEWVVTSKSNCSERCGAGQQRVRYKCIKILVDKTKVRIAQPM